METLAECWRCLAAGVPTRARARALYGAAVLADICGDSARPRPSAGEAWDIYQQFGDLNGVATTMIAMALQAQRRGRYAEATSVFGETVALWQQLGDGTAVDLARSNMANAAKTGGQLCAGPPPARAGRRGLAGAR